MEEILDFLESEDSESELLALCHRQIPTNKPIWSHLAAIIV